MAVYRCEVKRVSRITGRSAVAAAAYRAAERIRDERGNEGAGKVHDYRRRAPGVAYREMMPPKGAPEWASQRGKLWNEAERAERRKDACTARELIGSLPHELDDVGRIEATRGAAAEIIERLGVAVDIAIHRPDRKGDQRNHHAHLLFTTRRMDREGFTTKTRELDDRTTGPEEINAIREIWERQMNLALEQAGKLERVSRLSNAAQGIERKPQPKLGEKFTAMGRQGMQPRAVASWQEVAKRRALTKDETRPQAQQRHRLERQALAQRYAERAQQASKQKQAADDAAMQANAAQVMQMRQAEHAKPAAKVSPMRANMAAQAERKRSAKVEAEKQEAIKRALDVAAQQKAREQGPAHIAAAIMRDTSEAQRGQQDAQQQVKDEARKLDEERQRAAEVSAAQAWEQRRQVELRKQRAARDAQQATENQQDPGRVRKKPTPDG